MSIVTIKDYNERQVSCGEEEPKRSQNGFKYNLIPIYYDQVSFDLLVKGRLKIYKHDKDYSIGLEINDNNESRFKSIEKKVSKELKEKVSVIKEESYKRVYPKLRTNSKGKILATFYEVKNRKKVIVDPTKWEGITFTGKILFKISNVFSSKKIKKNYLINKRGVNYKEEEEQVASDLRRRRRRRFLLNINYVV